MKVLIKFDSVLYDNPEQVVFLIRGRKFALSRSDFSAGENKCINVEFSLAKKLGLPWKIYYHVPDQIAPVRGQVCIDELKFRS